MFSAAQPSFPDGVAPIMRSVNARSRVVAPSANDDSSQVRELLESGVTALADDVAEEVARSDLQKAAQGQVHLRMLHHLYVGGCPRDLSGCPTAWATTPDHACEPPHGYGGLCVATVLTNYSASQKEDFAWKCRASWPCAHACPKRFDGCPEAWTGVGDGVCAAPSEYAGMCSPVTDFSTFTLARKAEWSVLCDAPWPCN